MPGPQAPLSDPSPLGLSAWPSPGDFLVEKLASPAPVGKAWLETVASGKSRSTTGPGGTALPPSQQARFEKLLLWGVGAGRLLPVVLIVHSHDQGQSRGAQWLRAWAWGPDFLGSNPSSSRTGCFPLCASVSASARRQRSLPATTGRRFVSRHGCPGCRCHGTRYGKATGGKWQGGS